MESTTAALKFLEAALEMVESKSIREWATSANNGPLFLKMAENAVKKNTAPETFAAYIVCLAIGA